MCGAICPRSAISIVLDSEGFYRPIVDESICNSCGLCTTICYKFDKDVLVTSEKQLNQKPLYSAWANDDNIVRYTTSGGLGDLLAHQLLKDGYKVVGVIYDESQTRAEHQIAESEVEILPFRGSKYIQSFSYNAFKEVVAKCRNEKYAVFGTPCQIYALNRLALARNVRDNFFFVDLYCHGCPTLNAWLKYERYIKGKKKINKFDEVIFRSKHRGWGAFCVSTINNSEYSFKSSPHDDYFYDLFFSDQILNEACHDCKLRGTLEYTDIRLGDFWGKKYLNNMRGVSAISIATPKGGHVFEEIKGEITTEQCDYSEFLPYQSWNIIYKPHLQLRNNVLGSLSNQERDIRDAIFELRKGMSLQRRVVKMFKKVLAYFPLRLTNEIKKIYYKL